MIWAHGLAGICGMGSRGGGTLMIHSINNIHISKYYTV
jgi:hypothetical protein